LPYAAIPIATAISLAGNYPMIYPRKEVKTYGTKAEIEGEYHAGETVVVIDDLATTGGSKFEAIEKLTGVGLVVKDVVVLVDRQSGAKESLAQAGYSMHAVLTIGQLLEYWEETGKVEKDKIEETRKSFHLRGRLPPVHRTIRLSFELLFHDLTQHFQLLRSQIVLLIFRIHEQHQDQVFGDDPVIDGSHAATFATSAH
jgi:hypothetical protein